MKGAANNMTRNFIDYAAGGQKRIVGRYPLYEITHGEINQLYRMIESGGAEGILEAISTAFYAGFEAGHRATKAEQRRAVAQ